MKSKMNTIHQLALLLLHMVIQGSDFQLAVPSASCSVALLICLESKVWGGFYGLDLAGLKYHWLKVSLKLSLA